MKKHSLPLVLPVQIDTPLGRAYGHTSKAPDAFRERYLVLYAQNRDFGYSHDKASYKAFNVLLKENGAEISADNALYQTLKERHGAIR